MQKSLFFLVGILILLGCGNEPVFPVEPLIEFLEISPTEAQGEKDSIYISVSFTDGDGDLGDEKGNVRQSIRVKDSRDFLPDSLRVSRFSMPDLTTDARNPSIQGKINIKLQAPPVFPRNFQKQEIYYTVTIVDQAGNESNSIKTDVITILK